MRDTETKTIIGYFLIAVLVLIIIFSAYFFLMPIFVKGYNIFRLRDLNLDAANDYYSVLSSWCTFTLGSFGLILGFFYYIHKIKVEADASSIERKRKRLDDLIAKLDLYNTRVLSIINSCFTNPQDLTQLRSEIEYSYDSIVIMLELNQELLGLNESDAKTILKVTSFVDKSAIMRGNYISTKTITSSIKDDYNNLIQDARRVCYKNVC